MKKIFISLLAIAALAGCAKDDNNPKDTDPNALVPIRLNSGIALSSKAAVTTSATVQIEGWENAPTEGYTGDSKWKSTAPVQVNAAAAGITLTPGQHYNANENITTYIKGWYPNIPSVTGTVTIPNTDGTVDVLLASAVSGTKVAEVGNPLKFDHQTAQLIFKVIKGEGLADGTKIKSIKVKGGSVPTAITLATDAVTYTSKGDLSVPNTGAAEITEVGVVFGDPLMIEPVANNSTITLDIETVKADGTAAATYTGKTFTTTDNALTMGNSYTVSLTFGQAGISLSANITPWDDSQTGSGTIQ